MRFLTLTRGKTRFDWTDYLSYAYLLVGLITMFAPILWLVMSSLKTESAISQFPPTFLPYSQKSVVVAGHDKPLPLYLTRTTNTAGQVQEREMAQVQAVFVEYNKELQQKQNELTGPIVQKADLGTKGVWYRLRIGPINDKTVASKLCSQLKSQGLNDCLVMTE